MSVVDAKILEGRGERRRQQDSDAVLAPVFDEAMGKRLTLVRMKHFMNQAELAEKMGVCQQVISRLEHGRGGVNPLVTLAKLREVFGAHVDHILTGRMPEGYPAAHIRKMYRAAKRETRKPGSGLHRKDAGGSENGGQS